LDWLARLTELCPHLFPCAEGFVFERGSVLHSPPRAPTPCLFGVMTGVPFPRLFQGLSRGSLSSVSPLPSLHFIPVFFQDYLLPVSFLRLGFDLGVRLALACYGGLSFVPSFPVQGTPCLPALPPLNKEIAKGPQGTSRRYPLPLPPFFVDVRSMVNGADLFFFFTRCRKVSFPPRLQWVLFRFGFYFPPSFVVVFSSLFACRFFCPGACIPLGVSFQPHCILTPAHPPPTMGPVLLSAARFRPLWFFLWLSRLFIRVRCSVPVTYFL